MNPPPPDDSSLCIPGELGSGWVRGWSGVRGCGVKD